MATDLRKIIRVENQLKRMVELRLVELEAELARKQAQWTGIQSMQNDCGYQNAQGGEYLESLRNRFQLLEHAGDQLRQEIAEVHQRLIEEQKRFQMHTTRLEGLEKLQSKFESESEVRKMHSFRTEQMDQLVRRTVGTEAEK